MIVSDVDALILTRIAAKRRRALGAMLVLTVASLTIFLVALGVGAVPVTPGRVLAILVEAASAQNVDNSAYDSNVILNIRVPRVTLGFEVGAALAVSGAIMQGLFRNPLADPGLIGVSSGAGLAAAITIVLGGKWLSNFFGFATLPLGSFLGGLVSTLIIYAISTRGGRTSMATMLLAGVGFAARRRLRRSE